ncbi:MAG: geranylgeranylglycerol-phosphate geranylgeranyltransferase [Candidatus Nezhaarchaeales archaeon]
MDLEALGGKCLNPYLELMRPANSMMAGLASIIGFLIASSLSLTPHDFTKLLLLFTSTFVLSSSSMAMNDYFDREIDAVNQPQRPIPSGRVKPGRALTFSITLMIIGLLLSALVSLKALIVAIVACVLFTVYSMYLKRYGLIGNACVSLCVALTFIYGAAATGSFPGLIATFSSVAFLASMSREVVKGIIDVEGDRLKGIRTLAISRGSRASAKVAFVFMCFAVALSIVPALLGYVNWLYLPIVLVADAGLLTSTLLVLSAPAPNRAAKSKKLMLMFMGLALTAFLVGCI